MMGYLSLTDGAAHETHARRHTHTPPSMMAVKEEQWNTCGWR